VIGLVVDECLSWSSVGFSWVVGWEDPAFEK
jgi:hypothetical protein